MLSNVDTPTIDKWRAINSIAENGCDKTLLIDMLNPQLC